MRSRTSFFNRTVFWNDQRRFWPLTAGYALLWLLLLPLTRLTTLDHDRYLSAWNMRFDTLDLAAHAGYWVALFTAILFAMAAFSYLTNIRATNGLHALPARREALYCTHFLAGLCAQLVAQLLAVLLAAAVLASHGALNARVVWLALLALVLPTLFFYSLGVFCMMFTGQILAAPVFYAVLNVLVVGVETLARLFAGNFLYGWSGDEMPLYTQFSPIVEMARHNVGASSEGSFVPVYDGSVDARFVHGGRLLLHGLDVLCVYAAVGLVLAALGLLVYRVRRSEATGTTVAIGWAKPIFKYGVAFCTALALGQLLYYLFFGQYRDNGDYSLAGTLACMTAAGLIGYFLAEMLLKKSFHVFASGWRGAAAVVAALVLLGVAMSFDLTGYESYVPNVEQIEWANVEWYTYGSGRMLSATVYDAETLRLITDAHRAVARDKQRQLSLDRGEDGVFSEPDSDTGVGVGGFRVRYNLKNGAMSSRRYENFVFWANELGEPSSTAAALTALYNDKGIALQRTLYGNGYYADGRDPRELAELRFTGGEYQQSMWSQDERYLGEDVRELSAAEAGAIYEAILRDVDAGRVTDSLFDREQTVDSRLDLYALYNGKVDYEAPDVPTTRPADYDESRRTRVFTPQLSRRMTETLAVLKAMGIEVKFG